ncbi:unnamed protein product [Arabidopsis lyrata]|nr:unnamed protein product [Arabidopsis lyrata]
MQQYLVLFFIDLGEKDLHKIVPSSIKDIHREILLSSPNQASSSLSKDHPAKLSSSSFFRLSQLRVEAQELPIGSIFVQPKEFS